VTRDQTRAPGRTPADRAADEIAAFARLFEARRAGEDAGGSRSRANARDMDVLAQPVQRHLEHLGRAWLEGTGDGGRESLVALLAYGVAPDIAPHADRALAQLREAEARYRSGEVEPAPVAPQPRRRRPSRRGGLLSSHRLQIAVVVLLGIAMVGLGLASCGSWGVVDDPAGAPGVLTRAERAF